MVTNIETRVRLRLDEMGMMFKVFCEKIEMSDVAVRNIFKRNDCKVSDLSKMAEVLGVSIFYLIGEPEPEITQDPKIAIGYDAITKEVSFLKMEIEYLKEIVKLKDDIIKKKQS